MEELDRALDRLSRSSIELAIAICPSSHAHWIEDVAAESESSANSRLRLAWSLGGLLWLLLLFPCYFVAAALLDSFAILHWPFAPIEAIVSSDALRPWFNAISPIVLLGSLALSVYISLFSFIRARKFRGTIRQGTSAYTMNAGALVAGVALAATLVAYAYVENNFHGAAPRTQAAPRLAIAPPFEAMTFA